jgi:FHS family glucose/mannose:H+ symporter-like MFS transporter
MALLHAGFVLTGVVCTMLGPLLPMLSARWSLTDARAGYLFSAQYSGSMLGVWASSFLMSRHGHRTSLVLGTGLMALGSATLTAPSWAVGILSTMCFGIGFGLSIPATNLLVSELNPEKRASALNLINFSWGVGAASCPFFVAALLRVHRTSYLLYGIATLLALVAIGSSVVALPTVPRSANRNSPTESNPWRSRWVPVLGALFFLYVGSEAGLGGWAATYARRTATGTGTLWVLIPSFFWVALLFGRATAPLLLRRLQELKLAQAGLVLSAAGVVALLEARNLAVIAIGISLAGLGFSSIFPIAVATLSHKFGAAASRVSGVAFALAAAGGATLPWLIGYVSTELGDLKYGLLVPLFGCFATFSLCALLGQDERQIRNP